MQIGPVDSKIPLVAPTASAVPQELRAEQHQLIQAVKAVNAAQLLGQNSELTFAFDRTTRRPILRIVDVKTGEVLQQLPPERALRMAEQLKLDDVEQ